MAPHSNGLSTICGEKKLDIDAGEKAYATLKHMPPKIKYKSLHLDISIHDEYEG
jgi:hypothetical protein